VLEAHEAAPQRGVDWMLGVGDDRHGVEHLLDALGAGRCARQQDGDHHCHHHREQDLQYVGEKGRQVPDGHRAFAHQAPAEPQHGDAREVEDHHHRRECQGEDAVHS